MISKIITPCLTTNLERQIIHLYGENSGLCIYAKKIGSEHIRSVLAERICEIGDVQKRGTNLNADMTDWFMQEDDAFQAIATLVTDEVTDISKEYFNRPDIKWKIKSCWGAVYAKGDSALLHDHYPATWSAVYYVATPPMSSVLNFPSAGFSIEPSEGLLLIFPSNVKHEVPASNIEKKRIVVSMNFYPESLV